jgi:tyrosinase
MANLRRDIAKLNGPWSPEILWYAKAIRELQKKPPNDRSSWRYLGGIHGFDKNTWLSRNVIKANDPLPPTAELQRMWQQCQHGGWNFLPWHRGYLASFEAILAKTIAGLGGPANWKLPYWNYLNANDPKARNYPKAFVDPTLPDGTPNPLSRVPRGPATKLGPTAWFPRDITLQSMGNPRFTSPPGGTGFGGGNTGGFSHFGSVTGALESNPHNAVHVIIGGPQTGFMIDPNLAGLDPIFWLHHCNIDRLWAAWLQRSGNVMENGAAWRNGPSPRQFAMPDTAGNLVVFTPAQTMPGGLLAPAYDDLTAGTGVGPLGLAAVADNQLEENAVPATLSSEAPPATSLMGANSTMVSVKSVRASSIVSLATPAAQLAAASAGPLVMLNLENIRGTGASGVLNVLVGLPAIAGHPAVEPVLVDTLALFGLANASAKKGRHAGNGINVVVDITDLAKTLGRGADLEQLEVHLEQPGDHEKSEITVGRISVYHQPAG